MKLLIPELKKKAVFFSACLLFASFGLISIFLPVWNPSSAQIVIDPGHGGIDGGANREGLLEKDINLSVGLKLKSILEKDGYSIRMTRETDVSLESQDDSKASRHTRDLNARTNIINESNAQFFISVHVNCIADKKANGSIVFYSKENTQSQNLAVCIQNALNQMVIATTNRSLHSPKPETFYILRKTNIPGVLVETAFISNAEEKLLLLDESFHQQLAQAIADGVRTYAQQSNPKTAIGQ